jgi:HK97 family phage major capsid protein
VKLDNQELKQLRESYAAEAAKVTVLSEAYDALGRDATPEQATAAKTALAAQLDRADEVKAAIDREESIAAARERHQIVPLSGGGHLRVSVNEPDMYGKDGRSFLVDLFAAQIKGDVLAQERISRHQAFEVERYSVATATLGGIVPPQYLVGLYAKAQRFGRVLADQIRHEDLPQQGMSLIVPRLTAGTTAAIQASESATVATQDPTETDLSVPVRTIAGYSPVSRQTLERAAYSEAILFEDLVARYNAALDTQLISGSGASGQHLGLLNVAGINTATISSWTAANLWAAIVDKNGLLSQANLWAATVGAPADTIVMHPRRWGAILGLLDTQNRPLVTPDPNSGSFNTMGDGEGPGYGRVGRLGGVQVYTDANIPTNLGAGTNEDRIFVFASQAPILAENTSDPVTLAFEQQAGNALQVQLVCYGYSAFAGGRYPAAVGVASGAGLA